ncbi:hypothetical protein AAG906_021044 [Vitis piasezkii]
MAHPTAMHNTIPGTNWYMDSGATHHFTLNINILDTVTPFSGSDQVIVGNGKKLYISHLRTTKLPSSYSPLVLHQVYHTQKFSNNLISVTKLCYDNKVFVEFYATHFLAKDQVLERVFLQGQLDNGLYKDPNLWLKRLGHPVLSVVNQILDSSSYSPYCVQPCYFTKLDAHNAFLHGDLVEDVFMEYTSGYYLFLGSNMVSWSSSKQEVVSVQHRIRVPRVANGVAEITWTESLLPEGFVEGKRGKTLEEVADAYLDELINGCLVDANKRDFQGVIKAVPISVEKLWTSDKLLFPSCPKPSMEIKPVELFSGIGGFYHQYRSCHLSRQSSQKLGITELERKDGKDLCASIQKMKHLSSLLVISISEEEVLDLCHFSPLPSHRRFLLCIEMIYCPQKSSSLLKATIGRPEFVTLVFLGLRVAMGRLTSSQPKRKGAFKLIYHFGTLCSNFLTIKYSLKKRCFIANDKAFAFYVLVLGLLLDISNSTEYKL